MCSSRTSDAMTPVTADATALLSINVLLWVVSTFVLGKTWPVDFVWSGWPALQCLLILARAEHGAECSSKRQMAVCVLVALWGYRLTHNFVSRGGIGHEDWRYVNMRRQFGAHFWWISLFSVFLGQTIFLFAACLPLYDALADSSAFPTATDGAAITVAALAILLEAIADGQMDSHIAAKREKRTDAQVLRTGLWAWSRHPNYLGEMTWWWGVWLFSRAGTPAPALFPGLAGPLSITFLFTAISVKLLEDRQLANKGDEYRAYMREVPSKLLLLPPVVGRWLGSRLGGTAPGQY